MDFAKLPEAPAEHLSQHATNEHLAALIRKAVHTLLSRGVQVDPAIPDTIDEALIEKRAREPGGLDGINLEGVA